MAIMPPNEYSEMTQDLEVVHPKVVLHEEAYSYRPKNISDKIAQVIVGTLASLADLIFGERYGHRAVVLETVAAVPGMVGGLLQHLKSLRLIREDNGWIQTLLDEAENERMHLLIYNKVAKPSTAERFLVIVVQFFFYHFYFLVYLISPRTAHRVVGYFEEEAIRSYEHYKHLVETGVHENIQAPDIAVTYWELSSSATLLDMIEATIKDEKVHRDVNHAFANDREGTKLWTGK